MNSAMAKEFYATYRQSIFETEWLTFLGCPMLYDGGLCVNREPQEVEYHRLRKYHSFLAI